MQSPYEQVSSESQHSPEAQSELNVQDFPKQLFEHFLSEQQDSPEPQSELNVQDFPKQPYEHFLSEQQDSPTEQSLSEVQQLDLHTPLQHLSLIHELQSLSEKQ